MNDLKQPRELQIKSLRDQLNEMERLETLLSSKKYIEHQSAALFKKYEALMRILINEKTKELQTLENNTSVEKPTSQDARETYVEELEKKCSDAQKSLQEKILGLEWLCSGETGSSSECLLYHMLKLDTKNDVAPIDSSDLYKCLKLLGLFPQWKNRLNEMRDVSKYWEALVDNWRLLENTFIEEVGGDVENSYCGQMAEKTYELMKKILNDVNSPL